MQIISIKMDKKSQVATFMVLIIVILLLALVATMLIGEVGFQRIRLANIVDSALISSSSKFCQGLNQVKAIHAQMFYNYVHLLGFVLLRPPFKTKWEGYMAVWWSWVFSIQTNADLLGEAKAIVAELPKDLRSSLYDACFGGALINEPKAFCDVSNGNPDDVEKPEDISRLYGNVSSCDNNGNAICPANWDEVLREIDPQSPHGQEKPEARVVSLNYVKYLYRDSQFTCQYRHFKQTNPDWYTRDELYYYFNTSNEKAKSQPGRLTDRVLHDDGGYESYLRVRLIGGVPQRVRVKPALSVVLFLFCTPCKYYCCFWPGIVPHPFAWLRKIDMGSKSFGVEVSKKVSLGRIPFFGQRQGGERVVVLTHRARIGIRGEVQRGFEFRMEE